MTSLRSGWAWWPAFAGLSVWSWPTACVAAGLHLALVVVRAWAESRRYRVMIDLVTRSPAGTVVEVGGTQELPATRVRIGGADDPTHT